MDGKTGKTYRIGDATYLARPLDAGLYLVATPIGNLGDMTIRALETLAAADLVACEDTRTSRVLLDRYGISTKTVSHHAHNEAGSGARLIEDIEAGKVVALITDAGTPLVSDPGGRIAMAARERGLKVVAIPGASAVLTALARLASLGSLDATLVFYEAPHRISETIADMESVFGPSRLAAVCRELTKTFEECVRGNLSDLVTRYPEDATVKGEIVIVVAPPAEAQTAAADVDALLVSLAREMPASKAAAEASRLTGEPKADLYKRLLALKA
jgi:16S rRNA (cytidine1402-2'-O)-methyltransferase